MRRNFSPLFLFSIGLFLNGCLISKPGNRYAPAEMNKLTHIAIFQYLNSTSASDDNKFSKGLIRIDPLLCIRDTVRLNDTIYFCRPLVFDQIKYPLPKRSSQLLIPDSLTQKYRYTDTVRNYVYDYATIYKFSQLIPALKPNIFFMQSYVWSNTCGDVNDSQDTLCCRVALGQLLKFSIQKGKVTFLEPVGVSSNGSDFVGFRCFSRRKLERVP
jgi:hypothetical protein